MIAEAIESGAAVATRKASQLVLERIGPVLPELIGGSADLTGSNLTDFASAGTAGTAYETWLPVRCGMTPASFSRENPLRSQRIGD